MNTMQDDFSLQAYNFDLPEELIAQVPANTRDCSKLLVLDRKDGSTTHREFKDITKYFSKGDLIVVNDTKVFPARLHGKKDTGGKVEIFLLEYPQPHAVTNDKENTASVKVLMKSSKRPKPGSNIRITQNFYAEVVTLLEGGKADLLFHYLKSDDLANLLETHGQVPLPPYITRPDGTTQEDRERYQTVFANHPGAVAAPTAGLHFTKQIFSKLEAKGVKTSTITLHVGYGTFAPVRVDDITQHDIHHEYINVSAETCRQIKETKSKGNKVWAVGTTTVRSLEFAARQTTEIEPFSGWCDLYIVPGFTFKVVDHMITNFHLPQSSLLFLVAAFYQREALLEAYQEAIDSDYRFFSYGDSMVVI